jgi:hypothetical protein
MRHRRQTRRLVASSLIASTSTTSRDFASVPPEAAAPDLSKPNLTRLTLADQLYGRYLNDGQDAVTARANADARALQMIP